MLLTTAFTGFAIFDPGCMPATIIVLYLFRCETTTTNMDEYAFDYEESLNLNMNLRN